MSSMECSAESRSGSESNDIQCTSLQNDSIENKCDPYIGQEFDVLDNVYDFYNNYAKHCGFGIRKNSSVICQVTKEMKWKSYVCDKAGVKVSHIEDAEFLKRRRDTRTGCKAKLGVRKNKIGKWMIKTFIKEHNHMLDTPRRTRKHRSHHKSHKSEVAKDAMDQLYQAGVRPSNIAKMLNISEPNNSISSQNVIDHLRVKRQNNIGREGVIVAKYLQTQQMKDSNFFYSIELDMDGFLRSLFWADSRARTDYINFGDVVVFDVTYKTNKFLMPFAPFTGVNHHRQSILLGCALLADETEESFTWLFQNWLKCMFNKPPKTIITDMDLAMYNAVRNVFPDTRHRFCSWHINKHLVENISEMRDSNSDFAKDYWNWYNCRNVSSSEELWTKLLAKYQMENNKWLKKMWERRYNWIPAFLKDVFAAGMSSTGRSESMNSFFDGFVNSNTHLDEFILQYEHAVEARRHSEEVEDFKTMNSTATLISKTTIESHAGQRYTKSMFKLFQNEFRYGLECWHEKLTTERSTKTYLVGLSLEERSNWCIVTYDDLNPANVVCECFKFTTDGFLCKHILHIMCKKTRYKYTGKLYFKEMDNGR